MVRTRKAPQARYNLEQEFRCSALVNEGFLSQPVYKPFTRTLKEGCIWQQLNEQKHQREVLFWHSSRPHVATAPKRARHTTDTSCQRKERVKGNSIDRKESTASRQSLAAVRTVVSLPKIWGSIFKLRSAMVTVPRAAKGLRIELGCHWRVALNPPAACSRGPCQLRAPGLQLLSTALASSRRPIGSLPCSTWTSHLSECGLRANRAHICSRTTM